MGSATDLLDIGSVGHCLSPRRRSGCRSVLFGMAGYHAFDIRHARAADCTALQAVLKLAQIKSGRDGVIDLAIADIGALADDVARLDAGWRLGSRRKCKTEQAGVQFILGHR